MIFKKLRYLFFAYITLGFAKLLFVNVPPVVSVTALIIRDGKLLCIDLSYFDGLGLPGGVLENSEEATEALAREVAEETGYTVSNMSFLGTASAPFRGIHSISLVYIVEITGEPKESKEGSLIWIEPAEAYRKLTYPNAQKAVKQFLLS